MPKQTKPLLLRCSSLLAVADNVAPMMPDDDGVELLIDLGEVAVELLCEVVVGRTGAAS